MKVSRTVTSKKALKYFNSDQRMCYTEEEFQPLYFNEVLSFQLIFTFVTDFTELPSIIPLDVCFNDLSSEHGILLQHGQLPVRQHDQQD